MKALLLLLTATTLTMVGCVAGPYESSYSYSRSSYGESNYYQQAPQPQYYQPTPICRTFYNVSAPSYPTVYVPENPHCGVQYRNYSNRSVIVRHPSGSATVVAKSWD